jgi:hypothetical protein
MISQRQTELESRTFKGDDDNKFKLVTAPPKVLIKKNLLKLKSQAKQ